MSNFWTNVPYIKTDEGDKIIYPFSPPIFQTEVDENFTKQLLEEGRKLTKKDDDYNNKLAGNLKYGRSYIYKEEFTNKAEAYLKTYVERFFVGIENHFDPTRQAGMVEKIMNVTKGRSNHTQGTLKLDTLWINFSQKHDFNPPHTHSGVLSFVIFCKVNPEMFKVQADSNTKRAGEIIFSFGDSISPLMSSEYPVKPYENLMFIFPNNLKHYVPSYWIDDERISVSGNFVVV